MRCLTTLGSNMKAIGLNFTKNDFRFCVLEKGTTNPSLINKNKIVYPKSMNIPDLMQWFETNIDQIIDENKPDIIAVKVSHEVTKVEQIQRSVYPEAILYLIAKKRNININHYTSMGINATKFGQKREVEVYDYVDETLGKHPPYWDRPTKDALLVAWFSLL
jgi:Holliday junction resolvasome RuvABC endonuclease subunit